MIANEKPDTPGQASSWTEKLSSPLAAERLAACEQLLRIGQEAAAALAAFPSILKETTGADRVRAIEVIGDLGEQFAAVAPAFRKALRALVMTDRDQAVRTAALQALVRLGPQTKTQIPAWIDSLTDELPYVRLNAAYALRELGPAAKQAVAALTTAALRDADFRVRFESAVALWKIDRRTHGVIPVLIQALSQEDELLRWIAADCLGEMGEAAREAVPALVSALEADKDPPLVRMSMALSLERIDPAAASRVRA